MSIEQQILGFVYPQTELGHEILRGQIARLAGERERELLDKQKQMLASLATLVALGRVDNDGCVECEDLDAFIQRYS